MASNPPKTSHASRYFFLFLVGLVMGAVLSVMALRALQARQDPFPHSVMHIMQRHSELLAKTVTENRCAATDTALANLGLTRRVVLSVPHFLFMLETLRNSDLVAVLPERLVRGQSGLEVVEPPLAVAGFEMLMLWHERWHRDPAHQWLRQFIVNSLEEQTC